MSYSINLLGHKRQEMRAPIMHHQVRLTEDEAKKIKPHTHSDITPELTHMNINFINDPDRFKKMRAKLDKISEERVKAGGKKLYKSSKVFMTGNLQISDDSLEKMGWKNVADGKKLPADKQSPEALKNVKAAYADMFQSIHNQPELYGDVFSATLHLDESSPHVDFLSDPLDTSKPYQNVRTFLNGPKGTPKGKQLSMLQDKVMAKSILPKKVVESFDLTRGKSSTDKVDKLRELRKYEKDLEKREKNLSEAKEKNNEFAQKLNKASEIFVQKRDELNREKQKNAEIVKKNRETIQKNTEFYKKQMGQIQNDKKQTETDKQEFENYKIKKTTELDTRETEIDKKETRLNDLFESIQSVGSKFLDRITQQTQEIRDWVKKKQEEKAQRILEAQKNDTELFKTVNDKTKNVKTDDSIDSLSNGMNQLNKKLDTTPTDESLSFNFEGLDKSDELQR